MGFGVSGYRSFGLFCGIWGLGFKGKTFWAHSGGFRVWGFRVEIFWAFLGFGVEGLRVETFWADPGGFRVWGFRAETFWKYTGGFRVWGSRADDFWTCFRLLGLEEKSRGFLGLVEGLGLGFEGPRIFGFAAGTVLDSLWFWV